MGSGAVALAEVLGDCNSTIADTASMSPLEPFLREDEEEGEEEAGERWRSSKSSAASSRLRLASVSLTFWYLLFFFLRGAVKAFMSGKGEVERGLEDITESAVRH